MRGASSFDGVLRPRALIHTCGIGGGRVGFITAHRATGAGCASGTYSSSSMTPAFVSHLMRGGGVGAAVLATA